MRADEPAIALLRREGGNRRVLQSTASIVEVGMTVLCLTPIQDQLKTDLSNGAPVDRILNRQVAAVLFNR